MPVYNYCFAGAFALILSALTTPGVSAFLAVANLSVSVGLIAVGLWLLDRGDAR